MNKFALLGLFALTLTACAASDEQLRARAAFDLQCKQGAIRIVEIDDRTRGVTGCGQRATYVESCNGSVGSLAGDCTWVLNADARKTE